jgi:hypothetical protein
MATIASWAEGWYVAQPSGRWAAHAGEARLARASRAQQVVTILEHGQCAQHGAGHNNVVEGQQWQGLRLDHPHGSDYKPLYYDLEEAGKEGCSPKRRSRQWQLTTLTAEMIPKAVKVHLALLPSCTQALWTLGKALPVMRSKEEGAHR